MKKIISVFLSVIMLISVVSLMTFAEENAQDTCEHTTSNGKCDNCNAFIVEVGEEISLSITFNSNNNINWYLENSTAIITGTGKSSIVLGSYVQVSASATIKGVAVGENTISVIVNENTYTESKIIVIPHQNHTKTTIKGYGATCTKTGLTNGVKCSVCGEIFTKQTEIPATGHNYSKVVTSPTCTENGYTTYTCSCSDTYTADELVATGHTKETVKGYAATCTKAGLTDGEKCSVCDETLTAQKEIAMLSHTFGEWTVVTAPTISAEGVEERDCSGCGEKETRAIEKLSYIVGDVNNDGEITAADARLALRISAGLDTLESVNTVLEVVDYNNDKQITAADARLILRKSAGLA